ncbi:MAG: biotin/lipoyl-containing protein, partial [Pseudomonadota bacterium]
VFGDCKHDDNLYERDCSLQRRHQKVIEEAPAPGMTAEVRAAMGAAAVRAAEAIGYAGAGTIEFIVDGTGPLRTDGFWFMEMNTRLQVEHPVTEAVTGVDLVEWQLRVARGEPLPLRQDDITITGHAVEARLYAEDADAGFLPAIGRLDHLAFPADLRVDSGVRAGDVITPYYDPMIAKLIVHGPDRDAAFAGLERGLAQTQVAGLVTNAGFLRRLVQDADVRAGQVETGLIARRGAALTDDPVPCARTRAIATVAALGLEGSDPFTLWSPLTHHPALEWKGEALAARVTPCGPGQAEVTMDGETRAVAHGPDGWRVDGAKVAASVHMSDRSLTVFWGAPYTFGLPDPRDRSSGPAALGDVVAPMPGLVRAVHVAQGDTVAEGDVLAVLEAMKMEHALTAPRAGVVVAVDTAAGAQVVAGARLLRLEEGEAE